MIDLPELHRPQKKIAFNSGGGISDEIFVFTTDFQLGFMLLFINFLSSIIFYRICSFIFLMISFYNSLV
jgi:hypothetical protein